MARPLRFYWDTCAWIGLLNGEPDKKRELEIVYGHARNGRYELWTSTLSMVECRRIGGETNAGKPLDPANDEKIKALFRQTFVKPVPLAVDIADDARRLWREIAGLGKYQDAVHVASAQRWEPSKPDDALQEERICRAGRPRRLRRVSDYRYWRTSHWS